jgi:hypothetical protein
MQKGGACDLEIRSDSARHTAGIRAYYTSVNLVLMSKILRMRKLFICTCLASRPEVSLGFFFSGQV